MCNIQCRRKRQREHASIRIEFEIDVDEWDTANHQWNYQDYSCSGRMHLWWFI
jgi:hypothetical protein